MIGRIVLSYLINRAALTTMAGRYRNPQQPRLGRFCRAEIREIIRNAVRIADRLVLDANLERYKSRGNRLNTLLGIYSLAAYRALRQQGIDKEWAIELFADTGWRLYVIGVNIPLFFIRPFTSDPQKRLNFVLRTFLFFPFAEDPLGYRRTFFKEANCFRTDWYRCVVYEYFRANANEDEMDMFRRSWCLYDFALPGLIHPAGHYERVHTLSAGDNVCDMRWYGKKPGSGKVQNEGNI